MSLAKPVPGLIFFIVIMATPIINHAQSPLSQLNMHAFDYVIFTGLNCSVNRLFLVAK